MKNSLFIDHCVDYCFCPENGLNMFCGMSLFLLHVLVILLCKRPNKSRGSSLKK